MLRERTWTRAHGGRAGRGLSQGRKNGEMEHAGPVLPCEGRRSPPLWSLCSGLCSFRVSSTALGLSLPPPKVSQVTVMGSQGSCLWDPRCFLRAASTWGEAALSLFCPRAVPPDPTEST